MKGIFKKKMVYVVMFMVLIGTIFAFQRKEEAEKLQMRGHFSCAITWKEVARWYDFGESGYILDSVSEYICCYGVWGS